MQPKRSCCEGFAFVFHFDSQVKREHGMAWTTPELVEICIGMEINAYAPAEF